MKFQDLKRNSFLTTAMLTATLIGLTAIGIQLIYDLLQVLETNLAASARQAHELIGYR